MSYINMIFRGDEYVCRDELISYIADEEIDSETVEIWNELKNVKELNKLFNYYRIRISENEVEFYVSSFPMLSLALFLCGRIETVRHINEKGIDNELYNLIVRQHRNLFSRDSYDYTFTNALYTSFGLFLLKEKGFDFTHYNNAVGIAGCLSYDIEFSKIKDYLIEFLDIVRENISVELLESVRCSVNNQYSSLGKELNLIEDKVNALVKEWEND